MHSELYGFFRDQGSIIAGVLALLAAWIAYGAVRRQTKEQWNENRRQQAREGLIAARLLEGVLKKMKEDIDALFKDLEQTQFLKPSAVVPTDWLQRIHKPTLSVIWNSLGVCGREVVEQYISLDAQLDVFAERQVGGAEAIKSSLQNFRNIIALIRTSLDTEAKSYIERFNKLPLEYRL